MSKEIIIVFPGQGSQLVGMGHELYRNHHIAREVFEEVDETLGFELSQIIFDGPEEKLTLTPNTQPALMAMSMALIRVIEYESKKQIFDFTETFLGHSLGEYSALCSLQALNLRDTALILRKRGEAMQNLVTKIKTKMVAVIGLEICQIETIINENKLPENEICEIANDNCPGQVILSGTNEGVEFISDLLKKNGARSLIDLKVSAPFHCSLMKKASIILQETINSVDFKKLRSKFISNVTANYEDNPDVIKKLLIKQVFSRVRWRESIIKSTQKIKSIIEIGSGKVLTGMNKRINKDLNLLNISNLQEIEIFFKNFKEIL